MSSVRRHRIFRLRRMGGQGQGYAVKQVKRAGAQRVKEAVPDEKRARRLPNGGLGSLIWLHKRSGSGLAEREAADESGQATGQQAPSRSRAALHTESLSSLTRHAPPK